MIVADVNLLLYAVDESSPHHARARAWLEDALGGAETMGFAWLVLLAFLRLSTNPRVFDEPLDVAEALALVDSWLDRANATILEPTHRHLGLLRDLLQPLGSAANLTNDAHLAALAIEHRAELCSADADFARFPGLTWRNPLQDAA